MGYAVGLSAVSCAGIWQCLVREELPLPEPAEERLGSRRTATAADVHDVDLFSCGYEAVLAVGAMPQTRSHGNNQLVIS